MSHPQTLQIPFPEFMLSIPTIQDSSQKLYTQSENSHFSCKFHKKVVPLQPNCKNQNQMQLKGISLFSCIGVSEYYLHEVGVDIVVASDIDPKRCNVHKFLYPDCEMICGDITQNDTKQQIINAANKHEIDLIISTPPCQGMSTVGKNKGCALADAKDERNYLIIESFAIIDKLAPKYIIFENVPQLLKVNIPFDGKMLPVLDILKFKYGKEYNIKCDVFNCCNYGVPQSRERVFIRLYKKGLNWVEPQKVFPITTLKDAIGDLPSLEPGESSNIKNHWARKHPQNQIDWLRHTPTGCSAFHNKDHFPVKANGDRVKGYPNCYKRMVWDLPSPTITMRNEIMSSQDKVHPGRPLGNGKWSDARVLTLRELLIIMSLPADLDLPTNVTDTALRQYIGEGIPSLMMRKIIEGIVC